MRRLLPLALLSAGCTINVVTPLPDVGDASVDVGPDEEPEDAGEQEARDGAVGKGEDAGADTSDAVRDAAASDAGATDAASVMDAGALEAAVPDAGDAGAGVDATYADASGADAALRDATVCGPNPLRKQAPELRIVLDRSGSMRSGIQGLNCKTPDFVSAQLCMLYGIDCSNPVHQLRVECGGSQAVIDNWAPAVAAIKAYTVELASGVDFGLTVFPGGTGSNNVCSTGAEIVPIGPNNAGAIASGLDATQPIGSTPTAATLQAVAAQVEARRAQLGARLPAQHLLLVTDGAPNCIGGNTGTNDVQAHQATLAAIDALARLGVKTWVAGFAGEPVLAAQLQEYATHGGTSSWYPVQGPTLPDAILEGTRAAVACSYTLDHELAGTDVVSLDGRALTRDAPDGFVLRGTSLQLQGAACATMRQAGTHTLSVAWSCEP